MHDTKHRTTKPTAADSLRRLVDESLTAWEPAFTALDDMWSAWTGAAGKVTGRAGGRQPVGRRGASCDCGCEADHDECGAGHRHRAQCCDHCSCCACGDDADILIEARVGERRVVPLTLHNPRRRSLTATLQVGEWTSCSDNAPEIESRLLPSGEIVLEACETRQVTLVLEVGGKVSTDNQQNAASDVRCCTVQVCEIRLDGCGTTVRVAVAVLPSDCDALEVVCCGCGC